MNKQTFFFQAQEGQKNVKLLKLFFQTHEYSPLNLSMEYVRTGISLLLIHVPFLLYLKNLIKKPL